MDFRILWQRQRCPMVDMFSVCEWQWGTASVTFGGTVRRRERRAVSWRWARVASASGCGRALGPSSFVPEQDQHAGLTGLMWDWGRGDEV